MNLGGYQFPQSDYFKNRDKKHYNDGRRDVLLEQLAERFGELPADIIERVRVAESDELKQWAHRVLTAGSLQAVFAVET